MTQSAISHLVGQAETYLGTPLFDRTSRPVKLTIEGQRYVGAVVSALNILKAEGQHLQQRHGTTTLTVSCNLGYGNFWLLPKLKHFHEMHPDFTVNMVTTYQGLPELSEGTDIAIRFGKGDWPDCRSRLLFREWIVPVASSTYIEHAAPIRRPADLLKHTLLHASARDKSWFDWDQWFDHFGIIRSASLSGPGFDNHVMMMQAALSGAGVALGWKGTAGEFLSHRQLIAVLPGRIDVDGSVYLVTRETGRVLKIVDLFSDWLVEQARIGEVRSRNAQDHP